MKRKFRHGSVDEHPRGSGRYRVRVRVDGRQKLLATGLSRAAAEETAAAYALIQDEEELRQGITLAQFGASFLARREKRGVRSIDEDTNRWKSYVELDAIGKIAVATLRRADVIEWRDRLMTSLSARGRAGLAPQTVKNALSLLRSALGEAHDREICSSNVAADVRLPRGTHTSMKLDLDGILLPAEQSALLTAVPQHQRPVVLFALAMGVRWSEASWLRWEDLEGDSVVIRRSRKGLATKSGRPRRLPLSPPALLALAEARRIVPSACPWVFPGPRIGRPRRCVPSQWDRWVLEAGIGKNVNFHDLRHTTATSLIAGWWGGQKWSLEEVRRQLGHSSIKVTERYGRLLDELLDHAMARTTFTCFPLLSPEVLSEIRTPRNPSESSDFVNRRSGVQIPKLAPNDLASLATPPSGAMDSKWTQDEPGFFPTNLEKSDHVVSLRKASIAAHRGDERECHDALAEAASLLMGGTRE